MDPELLCHMLFSLLRILFSHDFKFVSIDGWWPSGMGLVFAAVVSILEPLEPLIAVLIRRTDLAVHTVDLTSRFSCIWLVGTLFEKFVKHEMPEKMMR
jgi:hypothetical protein